MLLSYALSGSAFLTLVSAASLSGEATFYGGNIAGGHCSFTTLTLPSGIYGTALANWDGSANCGACVEVTGPSGNKITAMVVDECPGCGINHLDLFPDAFAALADPNKGIIDVTWNYVDCAITAPLQLHLKDGVSAYWFSIQVVNAKKAVESVDVSTDDGSTWKPTTRMDYNFFENPSGFGTMTVTVKVTSVDGDEVIVKNVGVSSGISITTTDNFGTSSAASISSPAASKSTSSEVKQASMVNKVAKILTQALEATSISASSTASISGANFIEIKSEPTTLATVAAPILSSTYSAVPTTSAAPITSTEPSTLSESSYILSISKASTTSAAFTQTPSVGTTSAYTVPSSLVSGSVPSSTAVPSFIPVSSASKIVAGFGCLVGVCMALLF